jgi:pimeloyl-ACP methyl ester carboxylesterase
MTTGPFQRDGVFLNIVDEGAGSPVVFQHGLCADARQPAEVLAGAGYRRITLECRGHGKSEIGDPANLSIATFTSDLAAALELLDVGPAVVGGISMGAAIALRLAVLRPDLVRALVIARPAWVWASAPENMRPNLEVGKLLELTNHRQAKSAFIDSETGRILARLAPDNLASLLGFFDREPVEQTGRLLRAIAVDGPGVHASDLSHLAVPVLVIGHDRDFIHPLSSAREVARLIPSARLVEITPKSSDKARYVDEFRTSLVAFLQEFS